MNNKKNLKMKPVGSEYMEQYNALLRYVFQVTEQELSSIGWQEREIIRAKFPTMEKADVIGWFDDDNLVSQVAVYPMQTRIFGRTYAMGGLTGVGTYPEYSNMGLMHKLLEQALKNMKERGQDICYLYPYSIPFYRKMGWEIVSDKLTFTVKDTQLPKAFPVRGMVERVSLDSEDFHNVYSYFAMQHHGALIRDKLAWDEYWRWENDDMIVALYYNEEHKPLGYLVYYIANEIFHIKEMVYLTSEARHGLWNYISAHFSMITQVRGDNYSGEPMAYLFEDSEIEETIAPYIMARIVDVENFLQEYPWQIQPEDFKIHFRVTDGLASWNQGDFLVSWHEGETTCERVEDNQSINVVELDINTLTALMMGYKRPTYLYDHEKISMEYYMLTWLERLIPVKKPYFSDYF